MVPLRSDCREHAITFGAHTPGHKYRSHEYNPPLQYRPKRTAIPANIQRHSMAHTDVCAHPNASLFFQCLGIYLVVPALSGFSGRGGAGGDGDGSKAAA